MSRYHDRCYRCKIDIESGAAHPSHCFVLELNDSKSRILVLFQRVHLKMRSAGLTNRVANACILVPGKMHGHMRTPATVHYSLLRAMPSSRNPFEDHYLIFARRQFVFPCWRSALPSSAKASFRSQHTHVAYHGTGHEPVLPALHHHGFYLCTCYPQSRISKRHFIFKG